MATAKLDAYDILADAMLALRDANNKVMVETLSAKNIGFRTWAIDGKDNSSYIPARHYPGMEAISGNRRHAKSIKIGKDVSIKRIARPRTRVKTGKQEYDVDNGAYFLVRTPKGEAKIDVRDPDMETVWNYALSLYDNPETFNYMAFANMFRNDKVYKAYAGPQVSKSKKSKYEKAIEQLGALGVKPDRLMAYIDKCGKQIG